MMQWPFPDALRALSALRPLDHLARQLAGGAASAEQDPTTGAFFDTRSPVQFGEMRRSSEATIDADFQLPLVLMPFWAMFADLDLEQLSQIPFAMTVTWVYVLVANVVLVSCALLSSATFTRSICSCIRAASPRVVGKSFDCYVLRHILSDH